MITQSRLKEVLYYHPESGDWVWLESRPPLIKVGHQAGRISSLGYIHISVDNVRYAAHRLAWFFMTGEWPKAEIDHRDLNKSNNAWTNLRQATRSQNRCNTAVYKNNTCGAKGVHFNQGKYKASIQKDGKRINLGAFSTVEEAARARDCALQQTHGDFARLS